MKKSSFQKTVLAAAILSTVMAACSPDVHNPAGEAIYESENLPIPEAIALPSHANGYTRVATFYAEGVQKYKARVKAGTTVYEWFLVAPQANLFDVYHKKVGTHSAGPTWQLHKSTTDSIYGQQFAPPRNAPSPDANSIDWLLLKPKDGTTPTGIFAEVDYIHRIATKGGKAPAVPPASLDDAIDVKYTAVYRFTKKN
jgi:Protein of unknown function (DUF3455)